MTKTPVSGKLTPEEKREKRRRKRAAQILGQLGGIAKSKKKTQAARQNGLLGGVRPGSKDRWKNTTPEERQAAMAAVRQGRRKQ